jgi:hypothetical protein
MLPLIAAATLVRAAVFQHRWFIFSGAVLLHAILNGFAGLSYLAGGVIAAALAAVATGFSIYRASRSTPPSEGAH